MAISASIFRKSPPPLLSLFTRSYSIPSPPPPVPLPDDPIVSSAVSILKHRRSKSRWTHLRSLLTANTNNPLTPSQFSQIALQLRNNPHLALRFFNFTVQHSNLCSHSLSSYSTTIHILSRSRLKSEALSVIKSAMCVFSEAHGRNNEGPFAILEALIKTYRACDSAPFVFDLLVNACLESKKIDMAVDIYRLLKSKRVFLRTTTCNGLIELESKSRGCFAGYDLYREIFCEVGDVMGSGKVGKGILPNANTFNVVMVGFHREGMVEKVEEVWGEVERMGCLPNAYSFNVLMAAYCDDRRMEDVMKIWQEMVVRGVKRDLVAYNTVIGGFCRVGDVAKAEEIYREMVTNGVEGTSMTYEHLINGYCMIGDVDSVMLLYKDMCRKGFSPGSSTVNAIVRTLCHKNEVSAASEFWRIAEKTHEVVLESENYVGLIRGLCQEGKMEEASRLQAKMAVNGFVPTSEIYDAFVDGYVKQGNETMASKLKKEMLSILKE